MKGYNLIFEDQQHHYPHALLSVFGFALLLYILGHVAEVTIITQLHPDNYIDYITEA
jgi:hypothetical protein